MITNKKQIWHKFVNYIDKLGLDDEDYDELVDLFNKMKDEDAKTFNEFLERYISNNAYSHILIKETLEDTISGKIYDDLKKAGGSGKPPVTDTEPKVGFFKKLKYKLRRNKPVDDDVDEEDLLKSPKKAKKSFFGKIKAKFMSVITNRRIKKIVKFAEKNYPGDKEVLDAIDLVAANVNKDAAVKELYRFIKKNPDAKTKEKFMEKVSKITGVNLTKKEEKKPELADRKKEYEEKVKELELKLQKKKNKINKFIEELDKVLPAVAVTDEIKKQAKARIELLPEYKKASVKEKNEMLAKSINEILFTERIKALPEDKRKEVTNKYSKKLLKIKQIELELKKYRNRVELVKKLEAKKLEELLKAKYAKKEEELISLNDQYELLKNKLESKKVKLEMFVDSIAAKVSLPMTDDLKDQLMKSVKSRYIEEGIKKDKAKFYKATDAEKKDMYKAVEEEFDKLSDAEKSAMLVKEYRDEQFKAACMLEYKNNKTNTIRDTYAKKAAKIKKVEEELKAIEGKLNIRRKVKEKEYADVFSEENMKAFKKSIK